MFYGIAWTSIGVALIAKGVAAGPLWSFALWPGIDAVVLGIAYVGVGPSVLGKRADGTLPAWRVAALAPYFVATWSLWNLMRFLSRKPAAHEVAPGLLLGRRPLEADVPDGVRLIVDLTAEFRRARGVAQNAEYLTIPTLDASVPSDDTFARLVDQIARFTDPVYLHCASGHGRSATIAAAVLLARGLSETPEAAVRAVREARPGASPNRLQRRALQNWWERAARAESH